MARIEKIDNVQLKRFNRQEQRRGQKSKIKQRFYLIVCEGTKTEPNYFKDLRRSLQPGVLELVDLTVEGTGHNTLTVIEDALKAKAQLEKSGRVIDEVWAVFDRDSFPEQNFNNAILKGKQKDVHCAWTNQAFELWYLLHFQSFENAMHRDRYKELIERELVRIIGKPYSYQKNSPDMFTLLSEHGDIGKAVERAKRLEAVFVGRTDYANHNPCTMVYKLIEKLLFPKPVRAA